MKMLKKIGNGLLYFIEVIMPTLALTMMFVAFIVNVVARYIMNTPINACYELCLAGLLWCLLLSSPYATRKHNNVAFTLFYDNLNAKWQMIFRLVGMGFLILCFAAMLYPCFDWVMFMHRKRTAVLRIRMDIIYFPFVIFNALTLGHMVYDFVRDVITLVRSVKYHIPLEKDKKSLDEPIEAAAEGGQEA